jgi:hypothetical protein
MKTLLCLFFTAGLAISTATTTSNFSFEGLFLTDDQVQLFDFTLATPGTVTFQTWGYGGGTNAAGALVSPGGFESVLTFFDSNGADPDNIPVSCGAGNSYLGACLDAFGQESLAAGTYTLALTQLGNTSNCPDNFAGDLGCGFSQEGNGDYTPGTTGDPGCTAFCGSLGNTQEDGHWAVDILNVTSATQVGAVPEPTTWVLSIGGIAVLLAAMRRRGNRAA